MVFFDGVLPRFVWLSISTIAKKLEVFPVSYRCLGKAFACVFVANYIEDGLAMGNAIFPFIIVPAHC